MSSSKTSQEQRQKEEQERQKQEREVQQQRSAGSIPSSGGESTGTREQASSQPEQENQPLTAQSLGLSAEQLELLKTIAVKESQRIGYVAQPPLVQEPGLMAATAYEFGPRSYEHAKLPFSATPAPLMASPVQARQWVDAQVAKAHATYQDAYTRLTAGFHQALDDISQAAKMSTSAAIGATRPYSYPMPGVYPSAIEPSPYYPEPSAYPTAGSMEVMPSLATRSALDWVPGYPNMPSILSTPAEIYPSATTPYRATLPAAIEFTPRVDLIDARDHFLMFVHLPGVPMEAIHVDVQEGDTVFVHGRRYLSLGGGSATAWRREAPEGPFKRVLKLPQLIKENEVKMSFDTGVLTLMLPKKMGRKIDLCAGVV